MLSSHPRECSNLTPFPQSARRVPRKRRPANPWSALLGLVGLATCVAVGVTGCAPPSKSYVALGDSYTSGPVIPAQQTDPAGCQRSSHNYPHLVRPSLALPVFRDVSCSGAATKDMAQAQSITGGSNPAQLSALDTSTAAVSLTIGGNDIGFVDIIGHCLSGDDVGTPCQDQYVVDGHDEISGAIAATAPKVNAVLRAIHTRAPAAKIFVLGYQDILPDNGTNCHAQMLLTAGDAPYLRDKEKELNRMLAATAAGADATYVDTYTPSIGHDACQAPAQRWVEPLAAVGAAPVHPNAAGMRAAATALLAAMRVKGL